MTRTQMHATMSEAEDDLIGDEGSSSDESELESSSDDSDDDDDNNDHESVVDFRHNMMDNDSNRN